MKHPQTDIATLISSIFYLMSRYAESNKKQLVVAVNTHLALLEKHPDTHSQTMKKTCRRLQGHWLSLLEKDTVNNQTNSEGPTGHSKLINLH